MKNKKGKMLIHKADNKVGVSNEKFNISNIKSVPISNGRLSNKSNKAVNNNSNQFSFNTHKAVMLTISLIVVMLFSIQTTSALGVTPGRTTINFEAGAQSEIIFSVVNTEHKDMSVVFAVSGDLAEYITLKQTFSEFSSSDDFQQFSYSLNLPEKLSTPGLHEAEIMILELPKEIEEVGAFVGATVAVVTQLHVYAPFPNKYLEAEVSVIEPGADGTTIFRIPMVNRGKLDIGSARVIVDVYTSLNEKVATIESESVSIKSLERKEVVVDWTSNVNPGRYLAVVNVIYDNEITQIEKEFNIGAKVLEIKEISVNDFELGGIAKFEALVENMWSDNLKDIYLNILVYNDEGETMADFKSPTYDVSSLSKVDMVAYWDTVGVSEGTYDGKLILVYDEKSIDRDIQLKITDFGIEILGITGRVTVKRSSGFDVNNLLWIVLGFLVIANIVWFVVVKRIMKKKR